MSGDASNKPEPGELETVDDDRWFEMDASAKPPSLPRRPRLGTDTRADETPLAGSGITSIAPGDVEDDGAAPASEEPPSVVLKDPATDTARRRIPARNADARDDSRAPMPLVAPPPAGPITPIPLTVPPPANYKEIRQTARRPAFTPPHPLTPPEGLTPTPPGVESITATGGHATHDGLTKVAPADLPPAPIGRAVTAMVIGLIATGLFCIVAAWVIVSRNEEAVRTAPAAAVAPPRSTSTATAATATQDTPGISPRDLPSAPDAPAAAEPANEALEIAPAPARPAPSATVPAAGPPPAPRPPPRATASATAPAASAPGVPHPSSPGLQFLKRNL